MTVSADRLFAGLYAKGLFTWSDFAQRWTKAGPVTPLNLAALDDTLVVGHNPGGIFWSAEPSGSWSKATSNLKGELPPDAPVWELASNGKLLFAGAAAGIYYSEDRGRTWARSRQGLPAESPGVAFLVGRSLVLAATVLKQEP